MAQPNGPNTAKSLDDCQDEIFRLYIVEKKTLKQAKKEIEERHGVIATEAMYKARLDRWKYNKNMKRHEVLAILRNKAHRESIGKKESIFFVDNRPVDIDKVESFRHRHRIQEDDIGHISPSPSQEIQARFLITKTPPPQNPLVSPSVFRIPEKLVYELGNYIKGSFDSRIWYFNGNERLIHSSLPVSELDNTVLLSFIGALDTGCAKFAAGNAKEGGLYWRKAFGEIGALVKGQYYDIIPNMVQKINDLNDGGYEDAAVMLKDCIAEFGGVGQGGGRGGMKMSVFKAFADIDIAAMRDIEDMIMLRYIELFKFYLGERCYNTFVLRIDLARRKLARGASLDDYLPSLSDLDDAFGISNCRPMDVVRVRIETLYQRKQYIEMEPLCANLVYRAGLKEGDAWQQTYFLAKGWFYSGMAQYFLHQYSDAIFSLSTSLWWIEEFNKVDHSGLFDPEKAEMYERLEELAMLGGDEMGAKKWKEHGTQLLEQLAASDDILSDGGVVAESLERH